MYTHHTTPWTSLPNDASIGDTPVFALGDIHGQYDLFVHMLDTIKTMGQNTPFDLVLLGDFIDRGPRSLDCLNLSCHAGTHTGARASYALPGNHELMMLDFLHRTDDADMWLGNGGNKVMDELSNRHGNITTYSELRNALQKDIPDYWKNYEFPNHHQSGDITFVHAGISPTEDTQTFLNLTAQKARHQAAEGEHWAWIRWQFLQHGGQWPHDEKRVVVHGHTPAFRQPIQSPSDLETECLLPEGNKRICLDGGAASLPQGIIAEFKDTQVRLHSLTLYTGWLP
jgi:serine/threonine protein phosphatase 1